MLGAPAADTREFEDDQRNKVVVASGANWTYPSSNKN